MKCTTPTASFELGPAVGWLGISQSRSINTATVPTKATSKLPLGNPFERDLSCTNMLHVKTCTLTSHADPVSSDWENVWLEAMVDYFFVGMQLQAWPQVSQSWLACRAAGKNKSRRQLRGYWIWFQVTHLTIKGSQHFSPCSSSWLIDVFAPRWMKCPPGEVSSWKLAVFVFDKNWRAPLSQERHVELSESWNMSILRSGR